MLFRIQKGIMIAGKAVGIRENNAKIHVMNRASTGFT